MTGQFTDKAIRGYSDCTLDDSWTGQLMDCIFLKIAGQSSSPNFHSQFELIRRGVR